MYKQIMFITIITIITCCYKQVKQEQKQIKFNENYLNGIKSIGDENMLDAIDYLIHLSHKNRKELKFKTQNKISLIKKNTVKAIKFTSYPNKELLIDPLEINETKITITKKIIKYEF